MEIESLLPDPVRATYLRKFALTVVLVLVVVAAFGLYFVGNVSSELHHDVRKEMEIIAHAETDALGEWVRENRQTTRLLSEFDAVKSQRESAIQQTLDRELERLPAATESIHVVDLSTREIGQSTDDLAGTSIERFDLTWADGSLDFEEHTDVAVSEGYLRGGTERIAFVSPVEGTDTAVFVSVDASTRAEKFAIPFEGGYTYAVDSHGTIELAKNESALLSKYAGGAEATAVQRALQGETGAFDRDETDEVVAYAPVKGTDWALVLHAPQSSAYAIQSEVEADVAILIGIALLGFVLIGATIGRSTAVELRELADSATALAGGNLEADVAESTRIDEVGAVRDGFADVRGYLVTVADQADAIANQDFEAAILTEDVPGGLGNTLDRMQRDLEEFIVELEQARDNAQQAQTEAEEMARQLESQAQEVGDVMAKAADGDLTRRLDTDLENEAMREIAVASNEMLAELEGTVGRVAEFATTVDESSDQITASTEEVKHASEEVSRSVQEIAEGAESQNGNIQRASEEMTDLSAAIEEVASSTDQVAATSQSAAETGQEGAEAAAAAIEEMDRIESTAQETIAEIEALDEEMERIGEIVELITEIADQTNMLALNASIEAVRAGEAGDGFGVVADEIKGLAEETAEATQDVEELITDVQTATTEAVEDIRSMGSQVADGKDTVAETVDALERIVDQVESANDGVQSISDAADDQANSTEEVVAMVDEVGSISEETASQAEDVAAAAEEQTASISEVSESVRSLSERAEDLRELLATFEVRDGADAAGASGPSAAAASDD